MIRITQQDSAQGAKAYYSQADYLSQGQEIIGLWGGQAARLLGLEGVVDREAFERLCDNLDPQSGRQLTARTRSDRTVGYDLTFSVPKSVSLLYAMSGDQQILDTFRSAVDETMHDFETEMKARVRKGGKNAERVTGNMVWAEFIHTTSRPVDGVPDPQIHSHCFVLNATHDHEERQWKAGQFRDVKASAPLYQAMFRVRLANKLQDLGFGIERKRDDFEIAGLASPALLKSFSRRTELIEAKAREKGITDPTIKAELGEKTREKKTNDLSWDELRKDWDSRLTDAQRQALAAAHRREKRYTRPVKGEGKAVDFALSHALEREATVAERKVLTEALKHGLGAVTVEGVKQELARRPLIRGEKNGRMMVTTEEALESETRLKGIAREGRGRYRPLGDPARSCSREWFNEGQKKALHAVLSSRDFITVIRGVYGTGKTTLEQEIGEALAETGRPVLALAPSAAAGDVLREQAKFASADTVARFLVDKKMQDSARWGTLLVDEAGQLGTRDMLRLFEAAERVKARIVLVGDRKQTRSVSAGQPLKLLEQILPVAEVTEIVRQQGDYKRAAKLMSESKAAKAGGVLDKLGWIKEVPDGERYQALADAYLSTIREKQRNGEYKTALAVSPTWAEASRVTAAIRGALKAQGKLGEERDLSNWVPANLTLPQKQDPTYYEAGDLLVFHDNAPGIKSGSRLVVAEGQQLPLQYAGRFEVFRPGQAALAIGDRLRVTRNGLTKDGKHKLRNGALLTLQGYTRQGDLVVDHGWVIPKAWGHLALGYAVSAESSQGRTVDKVFVGLSGQSFPAANQRRFGVAFTRGKEQVLVFTDSKKELLKAVQRPDEPLSATELAEAMRRRLPLKARLKRHLASIRRRMAFAETHEPRRPAVTATPALHREMVYER
jgi:conjugative relaxase-like TrwC/TraI family protein